MRYWRKGQRADIKTDLEKPDAAQWPSVTVTLGGLWFNPRLGHVKDWDPLPPKVYLHFFDIFISQLLTARLLRQKIWRKRMMMFQVCCSCNMNVRYYCFCVYTHNRCNNSHCDVSQIWWRTLTKHQRTRQTDT